MKDTLFWVCKYNIVYLLKSIIKNVFDFTLNILQYWIHNTGDATDIRYAALTNCDLQMVGEEFSRKPYALAVRQGSPLKDILNDA